MGSLFRARRLTAVISVVLLGVLLTFPLLAPAVSAAPLSVDPSATQLAWTATSPAGADVTLDASASSNDIIQFAWYVGETTLADGEVAIVSLPIGSHDITLQATTDGSDWTAAAPITVTVSDVPPVANAGPDQVLDATGDLTAVALDGSASTDAGAYSWSVGGAEVATGAVATADLPVGVTEVTLTVASIGGTLSSTDSMTVTINAAAVEEPDPSVDEPAVEPTEEDVVIAAPPAATINPTSGIVNSTVDYEIDLFPADSVVTIELTRAGSNPIALGTVTTDATGSASGSFTVPATPGGLVQIQFTWGTAVATADFEVVPRIKVIPNTVEPGDTVEVSLRGYGKYEAVNIRWLINGTWVQVASATTSGTGSANVDVVVPANVASGPNSVRGDSVTFGAQTDDVTVVNATIPEVTLTPTRATVGSSVAYQIDQFPVSAAVTIELVRAGSYPMALGTATTNAAGSASGTFIVPATPGGAVQIRFTSGATIVSEDFEVVPRIRVIPSTVEQGETVEVSLRGFAKNEYVRIRWLVNGSWVQVATVTTSNSGSANIDVVVPANAAEGANSVRADGTIFSAQTNAVTVIAVPDPAVLISPTRGTVGTAVSFELANFPASSAVTITWRRPGGSVVSVGSATTDASGSASGTIFVPATTGGPDNLIIFTSGATVVTASYDVAPRIKVTPATVEPGQSVEVSLRGYGKNEYVRIRWLVNGSWVQVATVVTSNTGSATVYVNVPLNADLGPNSVRGDGTVFRAQTNAVTVVES